MADFTLRRLKQHCNGSCLADKIEQPLARAVPVDQKDDTGANGLQRHRQTGCIGTGKSSGADGVSRALVEPGSDARFGHRPVRAQGAEQSLEKSEAAAVQVRIRQSHGVLLHLDYQHMGVIGTDVVLHQQTRAISGGGGVQARMVELERCRAVEPTHEGTDQATVGIAQLPDLRTVDHLAGQGLGQVVDLLVQIHDQQVQAVPAIALALGQAVQAHVVDFFALHRCQQFKPVLHPQMGLCIMGSDFKQRPRHDGQVFPQAGDKARQFRHQHRAVDTAGTTWKLKQPGPRGDVGSGHFARQVWRVLMGVPGMGGCSLQYRQVKLEPVIGRQRSFHPHGQQQPLLAE